MIATVFRLLSSSKILGYSGWLAGLHRLMQIAAVVCSITVQTYGQAYLDHPRGSARAIIQEDAEPYGTGMAGTEPNELASQSWTPQPEPDWSLPADCGYSCAPRWYVEGDAFWLTREHEAQEDFTLSQAMRLDDFDFELNYRVTLGHTDDCLDGWEVTYVGGGQWEEERLVTGANLDSFLIAGSGFLAADFAAFNDASSHFQSYESELHSVEFNRRWWGWDVYSVKLGGRIVNLEEDFAFVSQQPGGDRGVLLINTENNLGLVQLGIDLMRPRGRLTTGGKIVGGLGINFNDGDALILNANDVKINTGDDSVEFAFLIETGVYSIYRATDRISLHLGYEAWVLGELALANQQIHGPIDLGFGRSFDETDELLIHGARAGVEYVW